MVMIQVEESVFQMVPAQCSFHSWRAGFRYQMTCIVYSITALRFYKIVDFIFTRRQLLTVVNDFKVWSMSFYNELPVDGLIYFACQTAVNDAPNIPKVDAHIENSVSYNYFFYCLLRSARSFSFILAQLTEWKIPIMKFSDSVEPAGKVACFPAWRRASWPQVIYYWECCISFFVNFLHKPINFVYLHHPSLLSGQKSWCLVCED